MKSPAPPLDRGPGGLDARLGWYAAIARLAPSKHNTQPWRFVVRAGALEVWGDDARLLRATDPSGRELTISCGAALHTARVAAGALGITTTVEYGHDEAGPLAVLREGTHREPAARDRELLAAVARRRTDRGPLDADVLAPSLPFELQDVAGRERCLLRIVATEGDRQSLARSIEIASRALMQEPSVEAELTEWVRSPHDFRDDGVPAQATRGAHASYSATFVQRDFAVPGVPATHDRAGVDRPLVAILCSPGDTRRDWLQAGQALMAVLLTGTVGGANASYLNQPLELKRTREVLRRELDLPGCPQLILRLGAGAAVAPTPRRSLPEVLTRG